LILCVCLPGVATAMGGPMPLIGGGSLSAPVQGV
jgi:hypothetical protein